jgi:eukaryotic-like serine/threonine-protein kinase
MPTLAAGTRLGRYEVLAPLGSGGMGEVYRARDVSLSREVAIKVLPAGFATDPNRLRRFEQEAHAVGQLNHPNVVTVHDVGSHEGAPFVVSELLEGETLRARIEAGPIPVEQAVDYALQVAGALAGAHRKGIVHRDLKPENVMVTSEGRVKVLDFGLAKLLPTQAALGTVSQADTGPLVTGPGLVIGTMGYMSPEQLRGQEVDPRTDLFAFGVVFYEMLTGRRPFVGPTPVDTATSILKDDPPPLAEWRAGIPPALESIIRRCLEKKPEHRFASAQEVAEALRGASWSLPRWRRVPRALRWGLAAAVVAALLATGAGDLRRRVAGWAPAPRVQALAVLPLRNLSGDPEQEYFADGMTDALIGSLASIQGLRVISRTSVMHYKGAPKPLPAIARELGVDAVVEGTVLRADSRVRLSVQLMDPDPERPLWSHVYEQDLSDVLTLHRRLAEAIAGEIRLTLSPEETRRLRASHRVDPAAHEAYLKGRFHWQKQTHLGVRKAIEHFEEALEHDPSHGAAYAGLADSYVSLSWVGDDPLPPREAYPKARAAAQKALERDGSLAEAHASLGLVKWRYDWDWPAAEAALRRAIELQPSEAVSHHWYGLFLATQGRHAEAAREMEKAQELDPLSRLITVNRGWALYFARLYEAAAAQERKAILSWPEYGAGHYILGLSLEALGRYEEALAAERKARSFSGDLPYLIATEAHIHARAGQRAEALKRLEALKQREHFAPSLAAMVYAGLGEKETALSWLERAVEERDAYLVFLQVSPVWEPLRREARFREIEKAVGLRP